MERTFVIRAENGIAKWVDVQKGDKHLNEVQMFGGIAKGNTILKIASEEINAGQILKIGLGTAKPE